MIKKRNKLISYSILNTAHEAKLSFITVTSENKHAIFSRNKSCGMRNV